MKDDHNQSVIFVKKKIMKNYQDISIKNDGISKSYFFRTVRIWQSKIIKTLFFKKNDMVSFHFGRWGLELRILQKNNNFETFNILVDMKILKIGPQNLICSLWADDFLWRWIILFDAVIMQPISTTIAKYCILKIWIIL